MGNTEENEQKKQVQIQLRLTEVQREKIKELAQENGKSVNQFILDCLLPDTNQENDNDKRDDPTKGNEWVMYFTDQLKIKDEQIKALNNRLEESHRLVDQQQQLQLVHQKNLNIDQESDSESTSNDTPANVPTKKWWKLW